uniref:Uncharacterized protein n=1 Tax=Anguilla anguilla TaxID=7936 RepID=A0A0E9VZ30_ANGAN
MTTSSYAGSACLLGRFFCLVIISPRPSYSHCMY